MKPSSKKNSISLGAMIRSQKFVKVFFRSQKERERDVDSIE
jgi:hypothetical protein